MLPVLNESGLLVWVELTTLQRAQHQATHTHTKVHAPVSATVEAHYEMLSEVTHLGNF